MDLLPPEEIAARLSARDSLTVPLATGQPAVFLEALGRRDDWEDLAIFCGLLTRPFDLFKHPGVRTTSGYFGPVERALNAAGARIEYLPSNFRGFQWREQRTPSRVIATVLSAPDEEGWCTFGTHAGAVAIPFVEACRDPGRLAVAELSSTMPVVGGDPEHGGNRVHVDEIDLAYLSDAPQPVVPPGEADEVERRIAGHVVPLIPDGATLQFGIGPVPDLVARSLAGGAEGPYQVHSELISDGFCDLMEAGKVTGRTVFTFAFGSERLYGFLDERRGLNRGRVVALPVTVVNDPAQMARHDRFVSLNSGLMVDFSGQVCSEAIGLRQYSGVGGQLSFVIGAGRSREGLSILCLKSTAEVDGRRVSNILPTLPEGSLISTPRHFTQVIVTEHGVADLRSLGDEHRAEALISVAHPDFRDELETRRRDIQRRYWKN